MLAIGLKRRDKRKGKGIRLKKMKINKVSKYDMELEFININIIL